MTEVGRLCVQVRDVDAQASASRTALAVRPLDLDSPSVPERAILCIRRLDDPLPGGIDIRSTHTRPTRWEHAARAAIGALYRHAPRLLRDDVSTHANAVVFEGRAELLACAAQSLNSRAWWWTNVITSPLTIDAVAREWLRTPHYIPSAIALLDAPSLRTFLQARDAAMAVRLTRRALEVHGIPSVARLVDVSPQAIVKSLSAATPTSLTHVVLEETSNIAIECRAFAMIAFALHESPVMTRRVLETLVRDAEHSTPEAANPTQLTTSREEIIAHESADAPSPQQPSEPSVPVERRALSPSAPHRDAPTHRDEQEHEARGLRARRSTGTEETRSAPRAAALESQTTQTTSAHAIESSTTAPIPAPTLEPIHTQYAGLFFLLNAAIALGYYDPYGRGDDIDLDVFEFLAMCGNEWIPKFEDDALYAFLHHDDELARNEEWLDAIREYVIDALPDVESPETFLLGRAGTIVVTPAHVDVHFILETHPIEIRIAGLDRDPGWIPAAGRHVAFHFD